MLAWIFFRAETVCHAFTYLKEIFSASLLSLPTVRPFYLFVLLLFFMFIEWLGRANAYAIERLLIRKSKALRWSFYMFLIVLTFIFSSQTEQEFIYFQF